MSGSHLERVRSWRHQFHSLSLTLPFNVLAIVGIVFLALLCGVAFTITLALPPSSALCFRCGGILFAVFVVLAVVVVASCAIAVFHIYRNLSVGRETMLRERSEKKSAMHRQLSLERMREQTRNDNEMIDRMKGVDNEMIDRMKDADNEMIDRMKGVDNEMIELAEFEITTNDDDDVVVGIDSGIGIDMQVKELEMEGGGGGVRGEEAEMKMKAVAAESSKWSREEVKQMVFESLKAILFVSGIVAAIIIAILGIVVITLSHTTLPSYSGTISLDASISEKISAPITVKRESNGVVHIEAETDYDVYFAQGFVNAQDRLFQMDINRRVGMGTASAVLGKAALSLDLFSRTLNLPQVSEMDFSALGEKARNAVQAYVDGINAYIAWPGRSLHPEYAILGFSPEPWTAAQAMTWVKLMSWSLCTNKVFELDRYQMLQLGHSRGRVAQLMPEFAQSQQTILVAEEMTDLMGNTNAADRENNENAFSIASDTAAYIPKKQNNPPSEVSSSLRLSDLTRDPSDSIGNRTRIDVRKDEMFTRFFNPMDIQASNDWVISGKLTDNGKPIVCNDPHLTINAPNIWTLVHLKSKESDMDVMGSSFPGIPSVVIGKNKHIAWGVTNGMSDVQDLFVMQDSDDKKSYMHNGTMKEYTVRKEVIKVKGAEDHVLEVKSSVYGPVINDIFDIEGESVSFRWVSLDGSDTTLEAFLDLSIAKNWNEFRDGLRKYVAPTQSFVFADKEDNIGHITPGKIPTRKEGHTGLFPVPGDGNWDWQALYIPFDHLPQTLNPPKGYIATANNRVQPHGYPYGFGRDFVSDHRQRRIVQVLEQLKKNGNITADDMKALQYDTKSTLFEEYKWIFPQIEPWLSGYKKELALMKEWDGVYRLKEQEPLIWEAFFAQLQYMSYPDTGRTTYTLYTQYILNSLKNGDPACQKHLHANGTPAKDCIDYAAMAFAKAIDSLKRTFVGRIPRWGENGVGSVDMKHQVFDGTPLDCLFSRSVVSPAGTFTVNVASIESTLKKYQSQHGPSYRHIIQLDDEIDSFILPLGNSGNTFSGFYDNMKDMWASGKYAPMRMEGYSVSRTLTIKRKQ